VQRFVLASLGAGLALCALSIACGPTASAPAAQPSPNDAFAVVRATSQAAYQAGQTAFASGDYLQACVDFDIAKTNDPDSRPEIQQGLEQALSKCLTPPPEPTSPAAVAQQRTVVVATIAAGVSSSLGDTSTPIPLNIPIAPNTPITRSSSPTTSNASPAATVSANASAALAAALVPWMDPQGRFSISAPPDWSGVNQPQTLVGTGIVEFHESTGTAEVDVAVDNSTKAVSPELYAATLELAMQNQVPGYASEQVAPGTIGGNPSVQRVFTFTERDASGQDHQARGLQVTVVKGSTPYLISASSAAEQYQQYSSIFDQIVGSFRFS
jgi:hypothetical protein